MGSKSIKDISIQCADNFTLVGTLFIPDHIKAAVMIGPATGIKRQFYTSFATYLCDNHFAVITFDNRGIGESKGQSINEGNPSLVDWGTLDMTAVLAYLKNEVPHVDYHLIGHSAGGQLIGLMKNATDLTSVFNVGSSSGSLQYARYPFKLKSFFFLRIYIPLCNLLFGQTQSQWIGMGEPLPKNVGKQWSRWCSGKGYIKVDLDSKIKEHLYDELTFNSCWVHASDDEIANDDTVKDMIRVFPKINAKIIKLSPQACGFKHIGHMSFFSSKKNSLWQLAADWLDKNVSED